jgi:hypothetical protein
MLVTKRLTSKNWPITATSARATMIEINAIVSGMSVATTVPKTSSRMIRAAGKPNLSSPCCRSFSETFSKSRPTVNTPVISTAKPSCPSASSAMATTPSMLSTSSLARLTGRSVAWPSAETRRSPPSK